ncbi:Probable enoyl-CoA hydratase 2, mitochondrial [Linum grandiflorum]
MGALRTTTRSLIRHYWKYPASSNLHRYQSRRTLILEPLSSGSVQVRRLSDDDSGIVEVNLHRPEARNAIGSEMLRGLRHTFETLETDDEANVVMISSSVPKAFCAGADLKERKQMTASEVGFFVHTLRSTFELIEGLRVPTIAVIEGVALGGGLELALSCDLRICGENAVLGLPETGLAIIPGAGGTQRLPRIVAKSVAKELIFTGRRIGGKEAMSIGLANYTVPAWTARTKALEIAREINQKGPIAIRLAKKAIDEGIQMDMERGLEFEKECYEQLIDTSDRLEGLAAFAEKRKPRYTGQ